MKKLLRILISGILCLLMFVATGCEASPYVPSAAEKDQIDTNFILDAYQKNQPLRIPDPPFSRTRETLLEILDQKIKSNSTTTIERAAGTGMILDIFPSIGYPIPGDTQLTSPNQSSCKGYSSSVGCTTVDQAESDGTYTSRNTDATYAIRVMPNGKKVLVYSEDKYSAVPYNVKQISEYRVEPVGDVYPGSVIDVTTKKNLKKLSDFRKTNQK
jgi:hypothetical protein